MSEDVFVRFVPKSRQPIARMETFDTVLAPSVARAFTPDSKYSERAQVQLAGRNITAIRTPQNRLETRMPASTFVEVFGSQVQQVNSTANATHRPRDRMTKHETFLQPKSELQIPDALKDAIEFAYVPRPVEYHAVNFLPPMEDNYHLRLESVCQALNAARCHRRGWTGKGVKVAMTDSGFARHPYFERCGYNIVRLAGPGADNPEKDSSGHGTGESANILALAPDATLICVKQGSSAAGDLEIALAQQPDVMTNSWGWSIDSISKSELKTNDPNMFNEVIDLETIVADAVSRGVVVCFSGGNGHFSFPASLPQVLAIGGVTVRQDGNLEASNYASSFTSALYPGRKVPDFCGVVGSATRKDGVLPGHVMLPVPPNSQLDGENFAPPSKGSGWGIFSGTSAASPQAAGVIALLKGINPKLTTNQVRQILESTAIDVADGQTAMGDKAAAGGHDLATGAGFIDAFRACNSVVAMS